MIKLLTGFGLAPCPFCGGTAEMESWEMPAHERSVFGDGSDEWYAVFCTGCYASGPACFTPDEAATVWNDWLPRNAKDRDDGQS